MESTDRGIGRRAVSLSRVNRNYTVCHRLGYGRHSTEGNQQSLRLSAEKNESRLQTEKREMKNSTFHQSEQKDGEGTGTENTACGVFLLSLQTTNKVQVKGKSEIIRRNA